MKWIYLLCSLWIVSTAQADVSMLATYHGKEMSQWVFRFLDQAEQSIEISGSYCGGELFIAVLKKIQERMQLCPQLKVSILQCPVFTGKAEKQVVAQLQKMFGERFDYLETTWHMTYVPEVGFIENHIKYVIVDEHYFSFGGTSLEDTLVTEGITTPPTRRQLEDPILNELLHHASRDQDVVGSGSTIAAQLRTHFYQLKALWKHYDTTGTMSYDFKKFASHTPFAVEKKEHLKLVEQDPRCVQLKDCDIRFIYSTPFSFNPITALYEEKITQATSSIDMGALYFTPSGRIIQCLADAAQRGVTITLITNGLDTSTSPKSTSGFMWGVRMNYLPLLYGKQPHVWEFFNYKKQPAFTHVSIYEYGVPFTVYHKKVCIIDKETTIIGSYNLSKKSHLFDFEGMLCITSKKISEQIYNNLKLDMTLARRVTEQEALEWYFNPYYSFLGSSSDVFTSLF